MAIELYTNEIEALISVYALRIISDTDITAEIRQGNIQRMNELNMELVELNSK